MKQIEILDLPEESRELIRECEVQGTRTLFQRNGRPVAVLISHDEYLALRETLAISNDALLYARIEAAEEDGRTGRLMLTEDLELPRLDRLRLAESLEHDWRALETSARETARAALEKLDDDPIAGAPLQQPFEGLWTYRADAIRIVYRIVSEGRFVLILGIGRAA